MDDSLHLKPRLLNLMKKLRLTPGFYVLFLIFNVKASCFDVHEQPYRTALNCSPCSKSPDRNWENGFWVFCICILEFASNAFKLQQLVSLSDFK